MSSEDPKPTGYEPSVSPSARERRPVESAKTEKDEKPVEPPPPETPAGPVVSSYGASVPGLEASVTVDRSSLGPGTDTRRRSRNEKIEERLATASASALRTRRARIDARIFELAHPIGEAALDLERLRSTKLVDVDRVLKKLDRVDDDLYELEREPRRPEGLVGRLQADLGKLADKLSAREVRDKRSKLVAELGLALLASDRRVLERRAPEVARLVASKAEDGRAVDELFIQSRAVDDELAERARDGRLDKEPKALERLAAKTGEVVGDATDAATDKLKDLGKQAAKAAVKQGGKAILGLATGALDLGTERVLDREDDDDRPRRKKRARDEESDDASDEAAGTPDRDVTARLRDLARLHADGIITDAEFARKKAELLDRL